MICKILNLINSIDETAGVLLTGSAVFDMNKAQDIDLIMISDKENIEKFLRQKYINSMQIIDGSFRFFLNDKEIGIVIFSRDCFVTKIQNIINGKSIEVKYKSWAIGCEFPEGFLGDIKQSIILRDTKDKFLEYVKSQVQDFPIVLRDKIKQNCFDDLKVRLAQLKYAESSKNIVVINVVTTHIIVLLVRLYFVSKNEYCRGIKHFLERRDSQNHLYDCIVKLSKQQINIIPFLEKEIKKYEYT